MIGFLLHSSRKKIEASYPPFDESLENGLLQLKSDIRDQNQSQSILILESMDSSSVHEIIPEKNADNLADNIPETIVKSMVIIEDNLGENVSARSQRRSEIRHCNQNSIETRTILDLPKKTTYKSLDPEIRSSKDANHQVTDFKSPVVEISRPFIKSSDLAKIYQFNQLLGKFEKYGFQSKLDDTIVKYSQSVALSKISKLLHIIYQVKNHK